MRKNNFFIISSKELIAFLLLFPYLVVCLLCKNHMMVNWLGIFCYIFCIYTWQCKSKDSLFSPYFIFMTFFVLFNYGQPIMWAFNIHQDNEIGRGILYYGTSYIPNEIDLVNVQLYVCLGMLIFHFGAMIFTKRNTVSMKNYELNKIEIEDQYKANIKLSMRFVTRIL